MINTKYLIIGGGISGLTFASEKSNQDYYIIESESIPGGLCKSFYQDGYIWDVAGHFFHFHSDETKQYFMNLMKNRELCRVNKCAKVFYRDKFMDAPFQYNIHQLDIKEFIECMTDLYFSSNEITTNNFKEYVLSKYGNGIASKFLIPYNEKLYACKMEKLEKNSMSVFLPKLDFSMLMKFYKGFKGTTYNDEFLYPLNGCNEVINALLEKVDSNRMLMNEKVVKVDIEKKIVTTNKNVYHYQYLINTTPFSKFIKMYKSGINIPLSYNKILILNLGFDDDSIDKNIHWVYFPGKEIFYRVGFYNNITNKNKLSIYVEIGHKANEEINIEEETKQTLKDLRKVGIINSHKLVSKNHIIVSPAYVHLTDQSSNFTNKTFEELEKNDVYSIGRYAKWQYSAMDDSFEQAIELANKI